MTVIHFRANHDVNGNPRRLWVLFADSQIVRAYDEGYGSYPDELKPYADGNMVATIDIAVSEYKRLLKRYG